MILRAVPNLLTMGNLFCGLMVIISSFEGNYDVIIWYALIALVLDFLDGTAARLLKAQSALGLQLDSLADMVSFGVAPALVLFNYYSEVLDQTFLAYFALLLAIGAALRLGIFNISPQSSLYFQGLPTPAMALGSFSIPLVMDTPEIASHFLHHPAFIVVYSIALFGLMVSKIPLLSLKLGSGNRFFNGIRIGLLIGGLLLFLFLKFFGIILCLIIYIVISLTIQKKLVSQ